MAKKKVDYDFSGWATKTNIKCSDGRIIHSDAFKEQDGVIVPLVWNHNHLDANNVVGKALLRHRDEGVYTYCSLNNTEQGKNAKELVRHGDIASLSIFANKLEQDGNVVTHGYIREVSLVLAGANPGAVIDTVIAHSDTTDEEAMITSGEDENSINLEHGELEIEETSDNPEQNPDNPEQSTNIDEQKPGEGENPDNPDESQKQVEHKDEANGDDLSHAAGKTVKDVVDGMNEEQQNVYYASVAAALEQGKEEGKKEAKKEDKKDMAHGNVFENQNNAVTHDENELTHSEFAEIVKDATSRGESLRDSIKKSGKGINELQHSITGVENLFPEVQTVTPTPKSVDIEHGWVNVVMQGVKHTPFTRVKSTYATLTADAARAKGYIKGEQKVEEVISALKRSTGPTTVYKLQKLDRDDVLDITDFDVVAWIKGEMKVKLQEEMARAILFGDGRSSSSDDKIDEQCIRPIVNDTAVYTTQHAIGGADMSLSDRAALMIDEAVRAKLEYKGAGNNVIMFLRDTIYCEMLLLRDTNGHRFYKSEAELATAMVVSKVVSVPSAVMPVGVFGLMVDLADYNVGGNKPAAMFDDFDINFNKLEYLIETRNSGALVTPYSAVVFVQGGDEALMAAAPAKKSVAKSVAK